MSDFDPGVGWEEISPSVKHTGRDTIAFYPRGERENKVWVREEPVPPLPTEPYTVIRVTWREYDSRLGLHEDGRLTLEGGAWFDRRDRGVLPEQLVKRITGFEVLAEPLVMTNTRFASILTQHGDDLKRVRRETAKAVLDRVRDMTLYMDQDKLIDRIAREFGVSDLNGS